MLHKRFFKTKDEAEITFEFAHPDAQEVCLIGEFNSWQPVPMKLNKKQGVFKCKQRLPLDQQYHFRYLINGEFGITIIKQTLMRLTVLELKIVLLIPNVLIKACK